MRLFLILGGLAAVMLCMIAGVGVAAIVWLSSARTGQTADALRAEAKERTPPANPVGKAQPAPPANPVGNVQPPPPANPAPPSTPTPTGELTRESLNRVKDASLYMRVKLRNGEISQGSGFFGYQSGLVLTNAHVLGMLDEWNDKPLSVEAVYRSGLPGERTFQAEILGVDRSSDLAVLRVKGDNLPAPLTIKPSNDLFETQQVYVVGFPLGDFLGKNITITKTTITSLRDTSGDGILDKLQTDGGMNPGNSGGPVINTSGDVIGVAVSGIRGTQLNFAIPGDFVFTILNGRVSAVGLRANKDGSQVRINAEVEMIDPLNRVKELALDFWTGPATSKPPGPSKTQPAHPSGHSPRQRLTLDPRQKKITGEIVLPELKAGEIYFYQPYIVNGAGEKFWAGSGPYRPNFDVATGPKLTGIKSEPANLTLRHDPVPRTVKLNSRQLLAIRVPGDNLNIDINMVATMLERPVRHDPGSGQVNIRLEYQKYELGLPKKYMTARVKHMVQNIGAMTADLIVDRTGNLLRNDVDLSRVPIQLREDLADLHSQIQDSLESLSVPLPNRQVKPDETWKDIRKITFTTTRDDVPAALSLNYRYLGVREHEGKKEAVIQIQGNVVSRPGTSLKIGGAAKGLAFFDLTKGQLRAAEVTATTQVRVSLDGRPVSVDVTLISSLERGANVLIPNLNPPASGSGPKPAPRPGPRPAPRPAPGGAHVLNEAGNLPFGGQRVHSVQLQAGQQYIIDLQSAAFDTYLELRDASGRLLIENDDISPGNLNSRIAFRAPQSGRYQLVVRSYQNEGGGRYQLAVRRQ